MKRVVVITSFPGTCYGDISFALKCIQALLKKSPSLKIDWVVESPSRRPMPLSLPDNVTLHTIYTADDLSQKKKITKLLRASAGIIVGPTFHWLTLEQTMSLKQYGVPLMGMTEYNVKEYYQSFIETRKKYYDFFFFTGLGEGHEGVFISEQTDLNFSKTIEKSFFLKWLLDSKGLDQFLKEHHLFFGYMAFNDQFSPDHWFDYCLFVKTCIRKAVAEGHKTIDIVAPLYHCRLSDLETLAYELSEEMPLKGIKVYDVHEESFAKNKVPFTPTNPKADIRVRLIDPFPLPRDVFSMLLKVSDSFVALTGDQSLIEGLIQGKVVHYHCMPWKLDLIKALRMLCIQFHGRSHPLSKCYAQQFLPKRGCQYDTLLQRAETFQGAESLEEHMKEHWDIEKNLFPKILEHLGLKEPQQSQPLLTQFGLKKPKHSIPTHKEVSHPYSLRSRT